jgi:hypothetical protein
VNDTLENDGVCDSWNRFKEIACQEAGAITYAYAPQMTVRGLLAPWKIENSAHSDLGQERRLIGRIEASLQSSESRRDFRSLPN